MGFLNFVFLWVLAIGKICSCSTTPTQLRGCSWVLKDTTEVPAQALRPALAKVSEHRVDTRSQIPMPAYQSQSSCHR